MQKNERTANVIKNTLAGVVQKIAALLSNFIVQVIFVRMLGLQYTGVAALFTSIIAFLSLAELGISTAITYKLYKPIAENDTQKLSAYVNYYAKAYRMIALVVFSVGLCLVPFIELLVTGIPDVKESIKVIYLLFLLDTVLSYLLIYKSTVLIAAQRQRVISQIQSLFCVIKCIALASALLIWKSYYAYLVICILMTVSQNLCISAQANKQYPCLADKRNRLTAEEKASLKKDIGALCLYKVSGVVLNGTDNIFISRFLGTGVVGQCANYNFVINNTYQFVMQFFSATTASVGNMAVETELEHQYSIFRLLNFIAFWIYCFASVSILVLIQPFISLFFGESSLLTMPVIIVLLVDFYIKGLMSPVSSFRTSYGLFVQGKYRPLIMAVMNIAATAVLMYWLGLPGVFVGTIVSRLLTQAWFDPYIIYKHRFKRSVREYLNSYMLWFAFTAMTGFITYRVALLIPDCSLLMTLLFRGILCLLLPNMLLLLCFWRTSELKKTLQLATGIIRKIGRKRG